MHDDRKFLNKLEKYKEDLRKIDVELYYLFLEYKDMLKHKHIYTDADMKDRECLQDYFKN